VLFTSPGLHLIGAMKIANGSVPAHSLVRMISSLRFVLSVCFCVAAAVIHFLHPASDLAFAAFIFSLTLIPMSVQLEWFFQGRETLTVMGMGRIIAEAVFTGAVIFAMTPSNFAMLVPLSYGAGIALQSLFLFGMYKLHTRFEVGPPSKTSDRSDAIASGAARISWRMLLIQSLPVGAAVIAAQALLNFPNIALGFFSTPQDIAHFTAAAKLVFFVLAIDRVMYSIFFPFIARVHAADPQSLPEHLTRVAKYIFLSCVPICIGGSVLAPQILTLVYGAPYASAALLLQIQLWYFFFTILNSLFSYPLIVLGHERYYGSMTTLIAVSTIGLMFPLAYLFASRGASAGLVIGEIGLVVMMAWKARGVFPVRAYAAIFKPLVASLVMGCFLMIFSYISLFVVIPAGALVYAGAAYTMKAFDSRDILFVKEQFV
ncbi:MAG TPA: polysaccharide biosynthesis C-terminal domain-containing protein, partial [Bacteroidota bacterium]|nr:polysaccharide biosynthesis C-terminal domain-containing protein [Bacteroidota bacterium]